MYNTFCSTCIIHDSTTFLIDCKTSGLLRFKLCTHVKFFAKTASPSNMELVGNSFSCFFMWKYKWNLQTQTDWEIPPRSKMGNQRVIKAGAHESRTGGWSEHLPGFGNTGYEFLATIRKSRINAWVSHMLHQ